MAAVDDRESPAEHGWTCPTCGTAVDTLKDDYYVTPELEVLCVPCGKRLAEQRERGGER